MLNETYYLGNFYVNGKELFGMVEYYGTQPIVFYTAYNIALVKKLAAADINYIQINSVNQLPEAIARMFRTITGNPEIGQKKVMRAAMS